MTKPSSATETLSSGTRYTEEIRVETCQSLIPRCEKSEAYERSFASSTCGFQHASACCCRITCRFSETCRCCKYRCETWKVTRSVHTTFVKSILQLVRLALKQLMYFRDGDKLTPRAFSPGAGHPLPAVGAAAGAARVVDRLRHGVPHADRLRDGAAHPRGVPEDTVHQQRECASSSHPLEVMFKSIYHWLHVDLLVVDGCNHEVMSTVTP